MHEYDCVWCGGVFTSPTSEQFCGVTCAELHELDCVRQDDDTDYDALTGLPY